MSNKNKIHQPHDKLFHLAMSEPRVVRECLELNLPEKIKPYFNLNYLKHRKGVFISNEFKTSAVDMLFETKFQSGVGYIYFLLEHQTSVDELMPLRIIKYILNITEYHLKKFKTKSLPVIYPMIFYHGNKPYDKSTRYFDLYAENSEFAQNVWSEPFQLVDLTKLDDSDLFNEKWAGVFHYIQKYSHHVNFLKKLEVAMPNLVNIYFDGGTEFVKVLLTYSADRLSEFELPEFENLVQHHFEGEETMYTIADCYREEGREEGIEKGKMEGRREALFQTASNLLQQGLSINSIQQATGISPELLETLTIQQNGVSEKNL